MWKTVSELYIDNREGIDWLTTGIRESGRVDGTLRREMGNLI